MELHDSGARLDQLQLDRDAQRLRRQRDLRIRSLIERLRLAEQAEKAAAETLSRARAERNEARQAIRLFMQATPRYVVGDTLITLNQNGGLTIEHVVVASLL